LAFNRELGQDDATYSLFKMIYERDQKLARQCYFWVEEILVRKGEYELCLDCMGGLQTRWHLLRQGWEMQKQFEDRNREMRAGDDAQTKELMRTNKLAAALRFKRPSVPELADASFIRGVRQLVEML